MSDLDEFLKSDLVCLGCGCGPIGFSTTSINDKMTNKYEDFCSMGCHLTYHNRLTGNRLTDENLSRCRTPDNK